MSISIDMETIALLQERIAPCHQPNTAAFANVIKNAGNGAITD
jgi:hypothetical protein